MLLSTVVLAVMSAGLFYASRVGAIQEELSVLTGEDLSPGNVNASRSSHIIFIMFTFTSPLILASVLSLVLGITRRIGRGR